MKYFLSFFLLIVIHSSLFAQKATVKERIQEMSTYIFSDPDPVPNPDNLFYPYFRFDGFTDNKENKKWKIVELENKYIRLSLFPEIGGKVWGAIDKTSGREFIYYNHVVKFRNIAMRGPWVSGGIEFNFGIIGHAPTSSTPVDYFIKQKEDGSASCYISAVDYITRTTWMIEVNLPPDKAYFTTRTIWHNSSSLNQPYYQWMNAAYKADGNIEFCFPGTNYIGHEGELHSFPYDQQGRNLAWYENNAFDSSKSYHVLGFYNDFYGAYWHDDDFGSVHHSNYDEKLGMKIFLWSQARDGAIWEELLTDADGQYVELQSGRMYNQPSTGSARTPFKHKDFLPGATDEWTEYWYPVKGTKGIVKANDIGALNVIWGSNDSLTLYFSPTQKLTTSLKIFSGEEKVAEVPFHVEVLQTWHRVFLLRKDQFKGTLKIVIGEDQLIYSEVKEDNYINRPKELPSNFDWQSTYGLYVSGQQWLNQKMYDRAEIDLRAALSKDPYFTPALIQLASLYYHTGRYEKSLRLCKRVLSLDAYDGAANYFYGLCNLELGNHTDAKDGFSVATYSLAYRSVAYDKLAMVFMSEKNWNKALRYVKKSIEYNSKNIDALQKQVVCYRKLNRIRDAEALIDQLLEKYPLNHFLRYEHYLLDSSQQRKVNFSSLIRNELYQETYMDLAIWYETVDETEEAIQLLLLIPSHPIACYHRAWLLHLQGKENEASGQLKNADTLSPEMVFPFRRENMKSLQWASSQTRSWKPKYYQAILWHSYGDKKKALELLNQCEEVNYAPFYSYRATLHKSNKAALDDLLKSVSIEKSWRTGIQLIKCHSTNNNWESANDVAKEYHKMYPKNYMIGLQYAKTLCKTGRYDQCLSLLKRIKVLPHEGAYEGRHIYRDANLFSAIELIRRQQYDKAQKLIDESKIWIENLGVGKPYDEQIDYRLENFLEIKCTGKESLKSELLEKIADTFQQSRHNKHFNANNLLTAIAMREKENKEAADNWVKEWEFQFIGNPVMEWCRAIYNNDFKTASELIKKQTVETGKIPWEATYFDYNFELIEKLFTSNTLVR